MKISLFPLFSLFALLFVPHLSPLSPCHHSPFLAHFFLHVSFFHLALLFSDTLNQGVIDNVSASLSISSNSLTLVCFCQCLLSLMSRAIQEAILSPQFHNHQNVYTQITVILEKMKSPSSSHTLPAFFPHLMSVLGLGRKLLCLSLLFLNCSCSMEEKIFLSAHSVCAILCLSWTLFASDHAEVPWKLQK